uniref:CBM-cenC domain-containing protein n=1 Tax=Prevotella sp. GTC17262 TaxID=3236797 RepID=A0AB33JEM3_9BACT
MAKVIGRGKITVAEVHDGIDGKSTYTHIRYSDDGGKTFTAVKPWVETGEYGGGRNLLKYTIDFGGSASEYKYYGAQKIVKNAYGDFSAIYNSPTYGYNPTGLYIDLKKGVTYTFSAYVKIETDNAVPNLTIRNDNVGSFGYMLAEKQLAATKEWKRYSLTFTSPDNRKVSCGVESYATGMPFYACGYKLEVGEIPTDWSPAKEEQQFGLTPGAWMGVCVSDKPYPTLSTAEYTWSRVQAKATFYRYSDYDFTKIGGSPRNLVDNRFSANAGAVVRKQGDGSWTMTNLLVKDAGMFNTSRLYPQPGDLLTVSFDIKSSGNMSMYTVSEGCSLLKGNTNIAVSPNWQHVKVVWKFNSNSGSKLCVYVDKTAQNTDPNLTVYVKNAKIVLGDYFDKEYAYTPSPNDAGLKESQVNSFRNLFSLKKSASMTNILEGVVTRKANEGQIRIFKLGLTETSAIDVSVSFDAKSNAENQTLICDCGDTGYQAVTIDTEYKHFELHFHTNRYFVSPYLGFVDFDPKDKTKETYIKNIKVCRGTTTGNYSLAPEDEDVTWPILHEDANHHYVGTMTGDEPSDSIFEYKWAKYVGEDAYQIVSSPASLVFDTDNKGLVTASSFSANKATVLINKGGIDTVPEKVEIDTTNCKFCAASVSGNVISVTAINTNNTTHYSEGLGHVAIKATLDGRTFYAKIPWAVNLHAVTANLKTNQDSIVASVSSLSKTVEGNKKTVDTNLATLDGKIEARVKQTDYDAKTRQLTTDIAQARTKADEIELSVKKKTIGGANLLKGASLRWPLIKLTDTYTQRIYTLLNETNIKVVHYDGERTDSHNAKDFLYVSVQNQTENTFKGCFLKAHVEKEQEYTASVWIKSSVPAEVALETIISDTVDARTNPVNYCVYGENSQVAKWQRLQYTFTAPKTGWVEINVWQLKNGSLYISEVQLEEGNTATSWHDPDVDEQFAAINLKADNIKLGLKRTGIDIDEEAVSVITDKFRVKSSKGTPIAVFKLTNDGNPVLQAPYIDVEELTVKKIEGATGTFKQIYASDGAMPGHPEYAKTMRLTHELISFNSQEVKAFFGLSTIPGLVGLSGVPLNLDVNIKGDVAIGAVISAQNSVKKVDVSPDYSGSHALYITHGDVVGFRPFTRRSKGSMTLSKTDSVIIDINSSEESIYTLPSECEDGQMYFLFSTGNKIYIRPSGEDSIEFKGKVKQVFSDPWDLTILVYDYNNHIWYARFTTQR